MSTPRFHTQIRVYDGGLQLEAIRSGRGPTTTWTVSVAGEGPLDAGKASTMHQAMVDGERSVARLTTRQRMGAPC